MIERERIPQTLLFAGLEGLGKATLARRFAAALLGDAEKIEQDDLSLEANQKLIEGREKLPSEKRNDDPLFFGTHPDFLTFAPVAERTRAVQAVEWRAQSFSDRSGGSCG
jgi:DNA polymerase III delta prime subunit